MTRLEMLYMAFAFFCEAPECAAPRKALTLGLVMGLVYGCAL